MTEASAPLMPLHMRRDKFDPVPELGRLRADEPVKRVETPWLQARRSAWLVTRHADVRAVLGDTARFSNVNPNRPPGMSTGSLLMQDPPEHTRLRRMLTPEFTVKRIRRLAPRIRTIVAEHLDAMERAGAPVDLVGSFALPIPSLVICELLGVPYDDRADFQRLARRRLDMSLPMDQRLAATEESRAYIAELVAHKRIEPDEDLIGMLIREHAEELGNDELVSVADLLLIAGHETTSNMLGLGTLLLLRHPDQAALLRSAATGDGVVDRAIEELMRYLSIVHSGIMRIARRDMDFDGQHIAAGDFMICALAAANRDAALLDDPDRFDITREPSTHVAFGHGVHHCLGAPLARMEMSIAYPALLRRFPGLRAVTPFEEVPFRAFSFVYGLEELLVTW